MVVWANLTNAQTRSGWLYLEITSSPHFPDQLQARAAGLAEGYLTRDLILKYYQGSKLLNQTELKNGNFKDEIEMNSQDLVK